jgi:hypothetical protein
METLINLPPSVFKPSVEHYASNIAWLNIYVIVVIILFLVSMFVGRRDRFDTSYQGNLSATTGFNSFRDSFSANTPYPYDMSCLDYHKAWDYAYAIAKGNNPDIDDNPKFLGWQALYRNYLKLRESNNQAPSVAGAADVDRAWLAVQNYQKGIDSHWVTLNNIYMVAKAGLMANPPTATVTDVENALTNLQVYQESNAYDPMSGPTARTNMLNKDRKRIINDYMNLSAESFNISPGIQQPAPTARSFFAGAMKRDAFDISPRIQQQAPTARSFFAGAVKRDNFDGSVYGTDIQPTVYTNYYPDFKSSSVSVATASGAGGTLNDDNLAIVMNGGNAPSGL